MLVPSWTLLSGDCEMPLDLSEKAEFIFLKSSPCVLSPEISSRRKGLGAVPLFSLFFIKQN